MSSPVTPGSAAPTAGAAAATAAAAASFQSCDACGHRLPELDARAACPRCGGLLGVTHPAPAERDAALRGRFDGRRAAGAGTAGAVAASGVWRFRELVLPGAADAELVTQPEGNTPLLARTAVTDWSGAGSLLLKHEGHNPTGSFKDRGMTVAITQARRVGAAAVACASTGNTSASLAAYAALAGLPALVLVPEGRVALGKLAQTVAYGARTLLVRGDFDDCLRLVREAGDELGVYLVNSVNPFRLQGQKTIVFEMLQQLGWDAPDWIVLPAGNLGNAAAFGLALRDARELGLVSRTPRLALVQAAGAAPFARSFADGFRTRTPVTPRTVASAIAIGDPASHDRAVRAVRENDGVVLAVDDEEILAAKRVIDASGVGCEPASAASVAGVRRLVASGIIARDARVVAVLTGHILKDPEILLREAGAQTTIDPTLAALERAMRG